MCATHVRARPAPSRKYLLFVRSAFCVLRSATRDSHFTIHPLFDFRSARFAAPRHASRAAADKLAPRAHLGRDLALGVPAQAALLHLLREALDEQQRRARVVEQRQPKVDRVPARTRGGSTRLRQRAVPKGKRERKNKGKKKKSNGVAHAVKEIKQASKAEKHRSPSRNIILIRHIHRPPTREVNHALHIMLVKHHPQLPLILRREHDPLRAHVRQRVQRRLHRGRRAVQPEPEPRERPRDRRHLRRGGVPADEHARARGGHLEARRAQQRRPVRLVHVLAEARDLARARHLCARSHDREGKSTRSAHAARAPRRERRTDAQERIRAPKPRPRKLRDLDRRILPRLRHHVHRRGHLPPHDRPRRRLDKIMPQHLRHERERARRAQVALDHLQRRLLFLPLGLLPLGILPSGRAGGRTRLADDLHVERPRDLERLGDLLRDALHARQLALPKRHGRQHERRVARVHARVLDVLRDGVHEQPPRVRDRVHVELLRARDELAHHDRVQWRDGRGGGEVVLERARLVHDVHRRAREHVRRPDEHRVPARRGDDGGLNKHKSSASSAQEAERRRGGEAERRRGGEGRRIRTRRAPRTPWRRRRS